MPKKKKSLRSFQASSKLISLIVVAGLIVLLTGGGWYWFKNVYQDPENVFWGMIENNLSTSSVTRHILQTPQQTGGASVDQWTRLQFGAQNASQSQVVVTQGGGDTQSIVKSQSIGTQDNDYSRYVSVQTQDKTANGQPIDFSSILGVWGKTDDAQPGSTAQVSYFRQAYLGSIVPFGQIPGIPRNEIVQGMKQANVYEVDYDSLRREQWNEQPVYIYKVKVNPKIYVTTLLRITAITGLNPEGLDPEVYANSQPIEAEFYVNPSSRQLVAIMYAAGQEEGYTSYGLSLPIEVPKDSISFTELQQKIKTIQE